MSGLSFFSIMASRREERDLNSSLMIYFIRINKQIEKSGFVLRTPQNRSRAKWSTQNQEKLHEVLNGDKQYSIRNAEAKILRKPNNYSEDDLIRLYIQVLPTICSSISN